jgi:hypothetical protein
VIGKGNGLVKKIPLPYIERYSLVSEAIWKKKMLDRVENFKEWLNKCPIPRTKRHIPLGSIISNSGEFLLSNADVILAVELVYLLNRTGTPTVMEAISGVATAIFGVASFIKHFCGGISDLYALFQHGNTSNNRRLLGDFAQSRSNENDKLQGEIKRLFPNNS